jgi:hypothetical protein
MDGSNGKTISGLSYSADKRQLYWINTKKLSVQVSIRSNSISAEFFSNNSFT